jgi:hypothetical protein
MNLGGGKAESLLSVSSTSAPYSSPHGTVTRRAKGRSLGTLKMKCPCGSLGTSDIEVLSLPFEGLIANVLSVL